MEMQALEWNPPVYYSISLIPSHKHEEESNSIRRISCNESTFVSISSHVTWTTETLAVVRTFATINSIASSTSDFTASPSATWVSIVGKFCHITLSNTAYQYQDCFHGAF